MSVTSEMAQEIVLNGRSIDVSDQAADASDSDYILIRTTGEPLNRAQKQELKGLGVRIEEFVGVGNEQIYLCGYKKASLDAIRALKFVDYANIYAPDFVVPSTTQDAASQQQNLDSNGLIDVDILLHHDVSTVSDELLSAIAKAAHLELSSLVVKDGFIKAKMDPAHFDEIAAVDKVRVIHLATKAQLFDNIARRILRFGGEKEDPAIPYRGKGQLVCVADTGFDNGKVESVPNAFSGRVKVLRPWGRRNTQDASDPDGHGTHVCGSVLGSGQHNTQGLIEGTAPEATLMVQSTLSGIDGLGRSQLGGVPSDLTLLFDEAYQAGARIHTNSWGTPLPPSGIQLPYSNKAEKTDQYIWDHQDMVILFAAGNDGQDKDAKGMLDGSINASSLGAEAAAKNCITVGATENDRPLLTSGSVGMTYTYGGFYNSRFSINPLKDDHIANNPEGLAAFSSRGPTAEGRVKPDLVAPGTAILSARSRALVKTASVNRQGRSDDDNFMYLAGTSMATPLVAGCCAILREMLVENGYRDENDVTGLKNPTGSLIKALLINGAVPINGQYMPGNDVGHPNSHSGFGRVDIRSSITKSTDPWTGYRIGAILEATELPASFQISPPDLEHLHQAGSDTVQQGKGNLTLKVTLVYADQPGGALSNDLNLVVRAGSKERHGNVPEQEFDVDMTVSRQDTLSVTSGYDHSNNVEQVVWPCIPSCQEVSIIVKHYRLMAERVPFAVVWRWTHSVEVADC